MKSLIVSLNRVGDNGGSTLMKTMVERAHANDDDEKEKESFEFVVPLNREIRQLWEKLPVKNLFIWVNFDLYKLNLTEEFVLRAEIMKTKNKYMTATLLRSSHWLDCEKTNIEMMTMTKTKDQTGQFSEI